MAGHSKFKNIQHRKGAQDKKRAKIFSRCAKEIIVATKEGGTDADMNPRLRLAIQNAKSQNMPNDNIARAIKTGSGEGQDAASFEEMRYEGYGPNAIAVIVEALTDNRNRTAGEVRAVFTKRGGNMGETNSVSFMFDRLGEIIFPAAVASADDMFEAAVEAGAENVESDDDEHVIYTAPDDFMAVLNALQEKLGDAKQAELTFKANIEKELNEEEAQQILDMIEAFEDIDDVQSVYTNMSVSDEVMAKLEAAE